MNRRSFLVLPAIGLGAGGSSVAASERTGIIELTWVRLRNGPEQQTTRARKFFGEAMAPALRRAGAKAVGVFSPVIAEATPSLLVVAGYDSLAHLEQAYAKLDQDKELARALQAYHEAEGFEYQRMERWLLRAFRTFPSIVTPKQEAGRSHIFELRTYESENALTLERKVHMFDNGEIDIFRKLGFQCVFFGYALASPRMPHLTYMVAFNSLADREQSWDRFRKDPDWEKLRTKPEYSNPGLVTNIHSAIYESIPGSDIV